MFIDLALFLQLFPVGGLYCGDFGLFVGAQTTKLGQLHGVCGAGRRQRVRAELQQMHCACRRTPASHPRLR